MERFLATFRSAIMIPVFLLVTLYYSLMGAIGGYFTQADFLGTYVMGTWARVVLKLFGIHVHMTGVENVPKGEGCIFVFNHTSHMDIPAVQGFLPGHLRFGAKIELFKIPFFGQAMRGCGVLPIVRQNREAVLKVYEDSISRVRNGIFYILAPEGTRQSSGTLGSFKAGPFIFAISGQFKIVPVVVTGAHEILPKNEILPNKNKFRADIGVRILPPISSQGFTIENRTQLQDKVRNAMAEALAQAKS